MCLKEDSFLEADNCNSESFSVDAEASLLFSFNYKIERAAVENYKGTGFNMADSHSLYFFFNC
jgi:hypothetical protein